MWTLTATVNYPEDQKEWNLDYPSLSGLQVDMNQTIIEERRATSFVFVIVPPQA